MNILTIEKRPKFLIGDRVQTREMRVIDGIKYNITREGYIFGMTLCIESDENPYYMYNIGDNFGFNRGSYHEKIVFGAEK